jgi:hypothetical protein
MTFENNLEFAKKLDSQDPLQKISARISFPEVNEKKIDFLQEILWVCNPKEQKPM